MRSSIRAIFFQNSSDRAYFLSKIRFDTAENEPAKNVQHFEEKPAKIANLATLILDLAHGVERDDLALRVRGALGADVEGVDLPREAEGRREELAAGLRSARLDVEGKLVSVF